MRSLSICLLLTSTLMLSAAPLEETAWQTPAEAPDDSKQQELDENLQPVSPKNAQPAESCPTVVTETNENVSYPSKEPERKKSTSSSGRTASSRESRQSSEPALPKIDRRVYHYNLLDGNPNLRYRRTDRGYEIVDENNNVVRTVVVRQSDKTDKTTQKKTSKAKIKHGKIDYCHDQVLTRDNKSCTAKSSCSGSSCNK
ncbi:MAG: hypothetical protein J5806_03730 [Lentisphaeria bacterium]|nr:hypothetical protein [Lentisphaeria bacterium]